MKIIVFFIIAAISKILFASEIYNIDKTPFERHKELYSRYHALQEKFDKGPLEIDEHIERVNILTEVLKREPHWLDGYWLLASESFIVGSSLPNPESDKSAREALVFGKEYTDKCLEMKPDQPLCKFFRASLLAKIASIDGIFASLKYGREISDAWLEVSKSPYNFNFRPNVTLLGSSYYGLGLFYRLVPDNFLIDWFWNIRGNKDKSIEMHRLAMQYDKENPCSMLMMSVALLCRYGTKKGLPEVAEAFSILDQIEKIEAIDIPQALCKEDVSKIKNNPGKTCGYTQAKYHEDEKIPEK